MAKYRKKPEEIDAIQWNGGNAQEIKKLLSTGNILTVLDVNKIKIYTIDGTITASLGDWIIKGIKGELYPCKPDIFKATYEQC